MIATRINTERVERIVRFIECLIVPSGEGAGKPFKLRPFQKKFIADVYGPHIQTEHGLRRQIRRAILSLARKNGKGLALDTPLPTPTGWKTIGEIREGDTLFDENGAPCTVQFLSPVHTGLRCWLLTFSDGSSVVADEQHRWLTITDRRRPPQITTTPEIADQVRVKRADGGVEFKHSIRIARGLQTPNVMLPLDPYLLGCWLGDGATEKAYMTCGDEDLDHFRCSIGDGLSLVTTPRRDRAVWTVPFTAGRGGPRAATFQVGLRKLGVFGDKHIPDSYLWAGTDQRRALLQGLMDTDGTVTPTGFSGSMSCCFSGCNERLVRQVLTLVRGLGLKSTIRSRPAKLNGIEVNTLYEVQFTAWADDAVFRLPRKAHRLRQRPARPRRSASLQIVACDEVPSVPTRCLQVSSPSSLFLCGEGMVPTHNTMLTAALALVHLVGPESVQNGEIYSAANDRDQAAQIYKFCCQLIKADPELMLLLRMVDSTKTIACYSNSSFYRAISSEVGTKHGLNPSFVIYDELAQSPNRDLYDVLDTSMGARAEPLFVVIGTQSDDPQHPMSQLIDDGLAGKDPTSVVHLYAVPDNCEDVFDEKVWPLANPALGDFRSLEDMRTAAARAKRLPSFESTFRNLFLNQRINSESPLIPRAEWMGCLDAKAKLVDGESVYLALDLSSTTDLTCLAAVSAENGERVQAWFWKPADTIKQHEDRDRVPYKLWHDQGVIQTAPGRAIHYGFVAKQMGEICARFKVLGLAYDRWRIDDIRRELDAEGIQVFVEGKDDAIEGALRLVPWGQGFKDMAPAVDALEVAILERTFKHDGNPCLTWNFANAVVLKDPSGNRKLDKSKTRFRIDGAVSTAMAVGLKARDVKQEEPQYEMFTVGGRGD